MPRDAGLAGERSAHNYSFGMWLPRDPSWAEGLAVALLCAALGLIVHWTLPRIVRGRPVHFLGVEAAIAGSIFHASMVGVLLVALVFDGDPAGTALASMWVTSREPTVSSGVAVPVLLALMALAVVWHRIPFVGTAASDRSSYASGGELTTVALVLQLLVRYPLTVFSEESVFRGYLQVHLRWGIVAGSVAFAMYHLGQWRTIPSLLPYALAGAVLVEWTGLLWPTAVVHYVLDAGFAVVIVRPAERRAAAAGLRASGRPS